MMSRFSHPDVHTISVYKLELLDNCPDSDPIEKFLSVQCSRAIRVDYNLLSALLHTSIVNIVQHLIF